MKILRLKIPLLLNNRGSVLIFSYFTLAVLLTLSSAFAFMTLSELRLAQRYRDSTAAFWLAESGINQFIKDQAMLDSGAVTQQSGNNSLQITKDDTNPSLRLVDAVATVNGVARHLQITFPSELLNPYLNTLSVSDDLYSWNEGDGSNSRFDFRGKTRIGSDHFNYCGADECTFENKQTSADQSEIYLGYPDSNGNGTADEKADFIAFNRALVSSLPPQDVLYIQSSSAVLDLSTADFTGKKVVYIEGPFMTWIGANGGIAANQNLSIITDGELFYYEPTLAANSRLDLISWGGYSQMTGLMAGNNKRVGVTYARGNGWLYADGPSFDQTGSLIYAKRSTGFSGDVWMEQYYGGISTYTYQTPLVNGNLPLGFDGLVGISAQSGYSSTPNAWKEL